MSVFHAPGSAAAGASGLNRFFRRSGSDPVYERWRWQVFAVTWLAYAGLALTRKPFLVAKLEIGPGTAIGLSETQLAWIDGAFLIAYAVGQFFWGIAGDRFGTRKIILIGILCSVVAAVAMGMSSTALALGVCFSIQGLCQSSGWAPLLKNVGSFFSQRERGVVLGLWCTNYAVGGLVASVLAGFVGQWLGWRWAFFVPAGVFLVVGVLFFAFQRNRPEDVGLPPIEEYHHEPASVVKRGDSVEDEPEGSWKLIGQVLTNPMILLLGLAYFFLKPARYALLFWGPKYVNNRLGGGMGEAGFLSGMFELAGPISILLGGYLSDRIFGSRRMPVSILCLLLLAGTLFVMEELPPTPFMLALGMFLVGFFVHAPDMLIGGLAAVDFGTRKGASTASGVINAFGSAGAVVGGVLPGFLILRWGWDGVFNGLALATVVALLLLLPKWNALPPRSRSPAARQNSAGNQAAPE